MTAAQPDPYEIVRLLPADTFTEQVRAELVEVVAEALFVPGGGEWPDDCEDPQGYRDEAADVVDALRAHIAAQQARPMPGAHNG